MTKETTNPADKPAAQWDESKLQEFRRSTEEKERSRVSEMIALAVKHNLRSLADEHIKAGTPIEAFRGVLLEKIGDKPLAGRGDDIGATEKEMKRYSVLAAARRSLADAGHPDFQPFRKSAEFECEVSESLHKRLEQLTGANYARRGILVPHAWFSQRVGDENPSFFKRDLSVGTASAGGNLVATNLLASQYIPLAYNTPVVVRAGARVLSGLVGNVAIPRMTGGAAAGWISAEGGAAGESDAAFGQVTLQPRDLGVFTDITRRLIQQSTPGVEQLVRDDFAAGFANAIDAAAINGSGSGGQPTGILQQAGIGQADVGTNGGAWTWSLVVQNIQNVLAANRGDGPMSWLLNAQTWGHAARTVKVAGQPSYLLDVESNSLAGFPYLVSQNVPGNKAKGSGTNLSAPIFGRFSDLMIGEWGVMDMLADPYTASNTGTVRLRAFMTVDVALRYAGSFSTTEDIVTT
jgi:HK97 family phage major capsid protein